MLKRNPKIMIEPDKEFGYSEEQAYESFEDYDDLCGPDAYLGDQYPQSSTGRLETTPHPSLSRNQEAEALSGEIRQEKCLENEELASESLEALEMESEQAGHSLPEE